MGVAVEEERAVREQLNLSHEEITYRDFQDLSKEQLKVLFNCLIDYIELEELKLDNEPKVILYITIHLKLDGYAPKFALHEINKLPTKDKEKSKQFSSSKTACKMVAEKEGFEPSRRFPDLHP